MDNTLTSRFLHHFALHSVIHLVLWMSLLVRVTLTIRVIEWKLPQTLCGPIVVNHALYQPVKTYLTPMCSAADYIHLSATDSTGFALLALSAVCWGIITVFLMMILERLRTFLL